MKLINPSYPGILFLHTCKGIELISINSIVRIEAISNYSKLFFTDGKTLVVAKVLKWFEEILIEKHFTRIHRSHLVNITCITGYQQPQQKIILCNREEILVSRRKKGLLLNQLSATIAA